MNTKGALRKNLSNLHPNTPPPRPSYTPLPPFALPEPPLRCPPPPPPPRGLWPTVSWGASWRPEPRGRPPPCGNLYPRHRGRMHRIDSECKDSRFKNRTCGPVWVHFPAFVKSHRLCYELADPPSPVYPLSTVSTTWCSGACTCPSGCWRTTASNSKARMWTGACTLCKSLRESYAPSSPHSLALYLRLLVSHRCIPRVLRACVRARARVWVGVACVRFFFVAECWCVWVGGWVGGWGVQWVQRLSSPAFAPPPV